MAKSCRRPEEIEQDLERTRRQMDDTMRAIEEKIAPGQWLDKAFRYFEDSALKDAGSFLRAMKKNPLPLALTGIGISWLILAGGGHSRSAEEGKGDPVMNEKYGQVKEKMQDFSGHTRERFGRLADDLRRRAGEETEELRHRMEQAGSGCRSTTVSVWDRIQAAVEEKPLAMGLLFFSFGAAAGAILPVSRRESRVMGKKREEVLARAEAMAREQLEEVGETVREAGSAAEAEVRRRFEGGEEEEEEQTRDREPTL